MAGGAPLDLQKTGQLLARNPDDPDLVSSALLLCDDPTLVAKGRADARTHEIVAAVLSLNSPTPQERLDAAKLLIENNPENKLGYLSSALALFQMGDAEKAWQVIEQSKTTEKLRLFSSELSAGQDKMFKESGYNIVERGLLARQDVWNQKILGLMGGLNEYVLDQAEGSEAADRASWLLDTIDGFRTNLGENLSMSQKGKLNVLEELTLRRLPSGFQMAEGGTAEDRADKISVQNAEISRKRNAVSETLRNSTYDIAEEYFRRVSASGEESANFWLLGEQN